VDWFELLTGFSPDGGNGSFELLIPLAIVAVILIAVALRVRSRLLDS
jgi:hypothetical protein